MKNLNLLLLTIIFFVAFSCDDETTEPTPNIDLSAESLTFELLTHDANFNGTVAIRGEIKNVGDDFQSGEGQQFAAIYEKPVGGTSKLLTKIDFTELETGESLHLSANIQWNAAIEFQPEFILQIVYDPDILIDNNLKNDDKNTANNSITKSGYEINELFNL